MAEFTEQQVYEALGLGAKEQEPAAPAPGAQEPDPQAEPTTGGTKEQEPADPASQEEPTAQEEPEGTPHAQEPEGGGAAEEPAQQQPDKGPGQQLTEEQRKENAARRRREETQAAIDKAVQDAVKAEQDRSKAEMDAFFAAAALKNTLRYVRLAIFAMWYVQRRRQRWRYGTGLVSCVQRQWHQRIRR